MDSRSPLFSFVATSRNDDHGGDVLRRTQSFVSRLAEQAARHEVRCELILVEWNPPEVRAPLADVLAWPEGSPWFSARVITTPNSVHRALRHSAALQMFQMIAKNVGIRRSTGDYVIATNIDIIFSDELFAFLKTASLQQDVLYRSDRWDIPNALQLEPSLDKVLARAASEAIRKNLRDGTYLLQPDGSFRNVTSNRLDDYFVYPIRNQLDRILWLIHRAPDDVAGLKKAILWARNDFIEEQRRYEAMPLLHTNGCGDFTMMSRYAWGRLRGYPEWHIFSWAIDSVILYQAHFNGIRIENLPPNAVHYHIEHDYGSGWSPEGAATLWERMGRAAIPYLDMEDFKRLVLELEDNAGKGEQTVYCGLGWGFAHIVMPEEEVAGPGLPARPVHAQNESPLVEDPTMHMQRTVLDISGGMHGGVLAALHSQQEQGRPVHRVSTRGDAWGYALAWELGRTDREDEFWLEIRARVRSGRIGLGILNHDQTDFVTQGFLDPGEGYECLKLRVRPGARATRLVCRNAGHEEVEVDLQEIAILEPVGTPRLITCSTSSLVR